MNSGLAPLLFVIDGEALPSDGGWLSCGAWKAQRSEGGIVIMGPARKLFTATEVLETALMLLKVEAHEGGIQYAQDHYGLTGEQMKAAVEAEYARRHTDHAPVQEGA